MKILPITDKHFDYAKQVLADLQSAGVRSELDLENQSLGKKIRQAKLEKIPHLVVIGDQEVADQKLTVESRDEGKISGLSVNELIKKIPRPPSGSAN